MTLESGGVAVLLAGIVSLLFAMASGILVAVHSYPLALGALVLSGLGWALTFRLATRS